jgi:c-di-AMP phosphodiesterase-like protein
MVAEIMQYMNVNRMPAVEAEALMAGIYLDTKNFMIRTSLHTFEASSYLRKAGANTVNVKKLFQVDMQTYMQKTDMVQNAKVYRKIVAIACWEDKAGSQFRIASAQAADEMLNIEGVQAVSRFDGRGDNLGAFVRAGQRSVDNGKTRRRRSSDDGGRADKEQHSERSAGYA